MGNIGCKCSVVLTFLRDENLGYHDLCILLVSRQSLNFKSPISTHFIMITNS